jgi:CHAT domain-containing protein/tetratricopeptide (TPR) repeat protein
MKQLSLLLLFLLPFFIHFGGTRQGEPAYRRFYQQAEKLYNTENPTDASDSLAFIHYKQVIQLLQKDRRADSVLADACTKAAILQQMKGNDRQAIELFNQALHTIDTNEELGDSVKFLPLLYCGSSYYTLHLFDSALHFYQQAELLTNRYPQMPEQERLYNKIGTLHYEEGNFHQALNFFNKALSLLDTSKGTNNFLLVNYYNNIAATLKKLGRYQEALRTYQLLLPYGIRPDVLKHNIATVYLDLQQPTQALQYLHAAGLRGQQQLNNLARAHLLGGNEDSAGMYIDQAMKSHTHALKTPVNGLSWYYLGQLQEQKKEYAAALRTYHRAIIELDPDFHDTAVTNNPTQFKGMHSFTDLFAAIAAKARIQRLLHEVTNDTGYLLNAMHTWESALRLAKTVQQGYDAEASRLFLNNNLQPASEEAVHTAFRLYQVTSDKEYLEKAFTIAETSKAAVLQIRLRQMSIADLPNMPVNLLSEQKTQQLLLGRLQVQYEQATDSTVLADLQQQIRDHEIRLSEITLQLEAHAGYAAAVNAGKDFDIGALQRKTLNRNMAMVSYYFIGDQLLAFVLDRNSLHGMMLPAPANIKQVLQSARNQIISPGVSAAQLRAPAANLYQALVQPLAGQLQDINRLIIIPDHDLQYIPFEILPDDNGNTLQQSFAISYNYSAAFAMMHNTSHGKTQKQLGVAPFGGTGREYLGGLAPLPASVNEIADIRGDLLVDSQATKQAFVNRASSYSTIHLATHAAANDRDPGNSFIAFYPSGADTNFKLYQPEIYNLDLHKADLVVLSACETGHGQFVHGEGMMSLARAFSYAGCRSVITSLWKADDASTAYIAGRLHHHLQKGMTKDVALQQAKLDYLNDGSVPERLKAPAYWSHLVLIGDAGPLHKTSDVWWWIGGGLIVLAIIITAFRRKLHRG